MNERKNKSAQQKRKQTYLQVRVTPKLKQDLRIRCVRQNLTIQEAVAAAVGEWLEERA